MSTLPDSSNPKNSYVDNTSLAVEDLVRKTLLHRTIADYVHDISNLVLAEVRGKSDCALLLVIS